MHGFGGVWSSIGQSIISASAALAGILIGAWMTGRSQKKERQIQRFRAQLDEFYAPLLGMRSAIKAKSILRQKLHEIAGVAWQDLFLGTTQAIEKQRIHDENRSRFESILAYSDKQLKDELIPLYREMVDLFTKKMAFAESSTRTHFDKLVEFVEIWNRYLMDPFPHEVSEKLDHSEKALYPFYDDILLHFERLTKALREE